MGSRSTAQYNQTNRPKQKTLPPREKTSEVGERFLCQMEPLDEQQPGEAVVRYDCDEVVDGRDERAGGDGGIDADLFEEDRDHRAGNAREQHRRDERDADAARNAERHERRFAAQQKICPDEREGVR